MYKNEKRQLEETIAEYKRLRKLLRDLDTKAAQTDARLVEVERKLPDDYVRPDDAPLIEQQLSVDDLPQDRL